MKDETWKPVVGYEAKYEVSDLGRVRCVIEGNHGQYKAGRIIKQHPQPNRYLAVNLHGPFLRKTVHTMVLESFKGPRPLHQVARHLNGDRTHNLADNLEWGTSSQNAQDAKDHGTFVVGSKNGWSILDEDKVSKMRQLKENGFTLKQIGQMFNTHLSNVSLVVRKRTWAHVT